MLFSDFEKAFNSINLNYIRTTLNRQGVAQKYVKILQEIYDNTIAYIKLDKNELLS